jgi:hypothetical protein
MATTMQRLKELVRGASKW